METNFSNTWWQSSCVSISPFTVPCCTGSFDYMFLHPFQNICIKVVDGSRKLIFFWIFRLNLWNQITQDRVIFNKTKQKNILKLNFNVFLKLLKPARNVIHKIKKKQLCVFCVFSQYLYSLFYSYWFCLYFCYMSVIFVILWLGSYHCVYYFFKLRQYIKMQE